jgi:hypothetical protein
MRSTDDPTQLALAEAGRESCDPKFLTDSATPSATEASTALDGPFVHPH